MDIHPKVSSKKKINFFGALSSLKDIAGEEQIYPNFNGHPNREDYEIIAKTVRKY